MEKIYICEKLKIIQGLGLFLLNLNLKNNLIYLICHNVKSMSKAETQGMQANHDCTLNRPHNWAISRRGSAAAGCRPRLYVGKIMITFSVPFLRRLHSGCVAIWGYIGMDCCGEKVWECRGIKKKIIGSFKLLAHAGSCLEPVLSAPWLA